MMGELSIIIPVYNVEPYIRRCVDSILNQTFTDFELILVDDGSPDNCPIICDEYASKDNRIKVIHKINGGLSDARNAGMQIASGEYIVFCDSDDYVSPVWCDSLLHGVRKEHNNFVYGSIHSMVEGSKVVSVTPCKNEVVDEVVDYDLSVFLKLHTEGKIGFACNVLFYADVLKEISLTFRKDVIIEDLPFCLEYLMRMESLSFCPGASYYYMQRPEATLSRKYHQDGFRKWREKYSMLQTFVDLKIPADSQLASKRLLADFYLFFFLDSLNNTFDSRSSLSWRQKMCYNQSVICSAEFQHCLSLADGAKENPKYLALLKKRNYYAAYLYVCAAKMKSRLKR